MGTAGRHGGEYYAPRPLIRVIVQVLRPRLGETIYAGACGSAGSSLGSAACTPCSTAPAAPSRARG